MAWHSPSSQNVIFDIPVGDDLFIAPDTVINPIGNTAVRGAGSGHHVIIFGYLSSNIGSTIALGNHSFNHVDQIIQIEPGGRVIQSGGAPAIQFLSSRSTIINDGQINSSDRGIFVTGSRADTVTTIKNNGTLSAEVAIYNDGSERLAITNTGKIFASDKALHGSFVAETLTNSGEISGVVDFGFGNDVYKGAAGKITGKVFGDGGLDRLEGGGGAEWFEGGADNDTLIGNGGNDTLKGDAGNDRINGGLGQDKLYGGANNDIFIFDVAPGIANRDLIYDFNRVSDVMHLDNADFKTIGGNGTLKATAFKLSTQVKDADDRIIYNKASGALFYDPDGSGPAAAIHFATLMNKVAITNADFVVI